MKFIESYLCMIVLIGCVVGQNDANSTTQASSNNNTDTTTQASSNNNTDTTTQASSNNNDTTTQAPSNNDSDTTTQSTSTDSTNTQNTEPSTTIATTTTTTNTTTTQAPETLSTTTQSPNNDANSTATTTTTSKGGLSGRAVDEENGGGDDDSTTTATTATPTTATTATSTTTTATATSTTMSASQPSPQTYVLRQEVSVELTPILDFGHNGSSLNDEPESYDGRYLVRVNPSGIYCTGLFVNELTILTMARCASNSTVIYGPNNLFLKVGVNASVLIGPNTDNPNENIALIKAQHDLHLKRDYKIKIIKIANFLANSRGNSVHFVYLEDPNTSYLRRIPISTNNVTDTLYFADLTLVNNHTLCSFKHLGSVPLVHSLLMIKHAIGLLAYTQDVDCNRSTVFVKLDQYDSWINANKMYYRPRWGMSW